MNWHYSKRIPVGKLVKIGVWEDKSFIGCIIFSQGASSHLSKPYNLDRFQVCELTRVALKNHKNSVSKILSIAIKVLKKSNKGLKLIVSFADSNEKHLGIIYQASNWIYSGQTAKTKVYLDTRNNKEYHGRNVGSYDGWDKTKWGSTKRNIKYCIPIDKKPKYRYLYPLDKEIRKQIEPLAKPYPKRLK